MIHRGIAEKAAHEMLARLQPHQEVMDQLEYVDSLIARDMKGRVANPPGLYIYYVRGNIAPPADFPTTRKRRLQAEAQRVKHAERARAAQLKLDYEAYCVEETKRYIRDIQPADEHQRLLQQHVRTNRTMFRNMPEDRLAELSEGTLLAEIKQSGRVALLSLEEFANK